MPWRIALALGALAPAIALALRDGRLTGEEQRELAEALLGQLLALVLPHAKSAS